MTLESERQGRSSGGFFLHVAPAIRDPIAREGEFLISNPGPFGMVFGRWTLIDV